MNTAEKRWQMYRIVEIDGIKGVVKVTDRNQYGEKSETMSLDEYLRREEKRMRAEQEYSAEWRAFWRRLFGFRQAAK